LGAAFGFGATACDDTPGRVACGYATQALESFEKRRPGD
jgi:hypothetical protein